MVLFSVLALCDLHECQAGLKPLVQVLGWSRVLLPHYWLRDTWNKKPAGNTTGKVKTTSSIAARTENHPLSRVYPESSNSKNGDALKSTQLYCDSDLSSADFPL